MNRSSSAFKLSSIHNSTPEAIVQVIVFNEQLRQLLQAIERSIVLNDQLASNTRATATPIGIVAKSERATAIAAKYKSYKIELIGSEGSASCI